jgi:hypothetical protein
MEDHEVPLGASWAAVTAAEGVVTETGSTRKQESQCACIWGACHW